MAGSTDAILSFAAIAGVFYLLGLLVQMIEHGINSQVRGKKIKPDPFKSMQDGQGWNWDWVFVFSVRDEDWAGTQGEEGKEKNDLQRKMTIQQIALDVKNADLEYKIYKSRFYDKVFMKIRANRERLCAMGDQLDYKLKLDENDIKERMMKGRLDPLKVGEDYPYLMFPRKDGWIFMGEEMRTAISDTEEQCPYQWYEYIYGKYDKNVDLQSLYQIHNESNSPFRGVDRIKLIQKILETEKSVNGAGFNLKEFAVKQVTRATYPLHDFDELVPLQRRWLVYWQYPWNMPVDDIKDYYGEKIGLYFLFIGHYTTWLIPAGLVGIAAFADVASKGFDPNARSIPYYCVFMAIWATLFLEYWKRKQIKYAMYWGMTDFESQQSVRPEFAAHHQVVSIKSPINGEDEKYFPPNIASRKKTISQSIIFTALVIVFCTVMMVFGAKVMTGPGAPYDMNWTLPFKIAGTAITIPIGSLVCEVANVVQVQLFAFLYKEFAAKQLNAFENHRTETEFEDNLIAKVFVFNFINTFSAVVVIAFFKQPFADFMRLRSAGCVGTCMGELGAKLGSLFVAQLLTKNIVAVFLPYLAFKKQVLADEAAEDEAEEARTAAAAAKAQKSGALAEGGETKDAAKAGEEEEEEEEEAPDIDWSHRRASPAEEQFSMNHYDILLGPFDDFSELIVQYGYVTLFVAAFPLAPIMAAANNYLQIRVDGWHLSQKCRRPWPAGAEDIGTWQSILETVSDLAVISNSLLISFTGTFMDDYTVFERTMLFVVIEHSLFFFKNLFALIIDDVPSEVQIQMDRNEFIVRKLVFREEDEEPDPPFGIAEDEGGLAGTDLMVYHEDATEFFLDYPGYEAARVIADGTDADKAGQGAQLVVDWTKSAADKEANQI